MLIRLKMKHLIIAAVVSITLAAGSLFVPTGASSCFAVESETHQNVIAAELTK